MPRTMPDPPSEFPERPLAAGTSRPPLVERLVCSVEVVTPLVGGGAEKNQNDAVTLVRGTSIRGHLRFWWRSLYPASLQREAEVWGSTQFPSPVSVRVREVEDSRPLAWREREHYGFGNTPPAYALFAAEENKAVIRAHGVRFKLEVTWLTKARLAEVRGVQNDRHRASQLASGDDIGNEVCAAVNAWICFGGVGARTRRGCGAVLLKDPKLTSTGDLLPRLVRRGWWILVAKPCPDAMTAWSRSLEAYRAFRQDDSRGKPRVKTYRKGRAVAGRSFWPEADSIRQITGCSLRRRPNELATDDTGNENHGHSTPLVPADTMPGFPRAALGLPIVFQFVDDPGKHAPARSEEDPKQVRLQPVNAGADKKDGRLASPIFTRPLFLDGRWLPAVLVAPHPWLGSLRVRLVGEGANANHQNVDETYSYDRVVNQAFGALRPMQGHCDAIGALIAYLKSKNYEERGQ